MEKVATFPLLKKKNVCDQQCHSTNYEELYICTENLNNTLIKKTSDPNLLCLLLANFSAYQQRQK